MLTRNAQNEFQTNKSHEHTTKDEISTTKKDDSSHETKHEEGGDNRGNGGGVSEGITGTVDVAKTVESVDRQITTSTSENAPNTPSQTANVLILATFNTSNAIGIQ